MTGARRRAIVIAVIAAAALALLAVRLMSAGRTASSPPAAHRPTLLLLTALPLLFNEDFSLQRSGSPALKALQSRYRVVPISVADGRALARGRLVLMAQPQAQTPENLVALDAWVRRGGRLLLLADPRLEWPSSLALGDPGRAPPMFVDTGLLAHWGLRLDAPDSDGPARRRLGGYEVMTVAPGSLYGRCNVSADRLVADCRIGKGEAIVAADADFLNADQLGPDATNNLPALLAELATLDHP